MPVRRAHACFVFELAGTSRTGSGRAAAPPGSCAARAPLPLPPQARRTKGASLLGDQPGSGQRSQVNQNPARPLLRAENGRRAEGRSNYCKYAKAEALGRERARCRRGQGALTSPARHSRGSRLHVPRASPARSTSLRRARARPRTRLPRSLLCSRPREAHFDGSGSRPSGGQSVSALLPPPTPSEPRQGRPFPCPRGLGLQPWAAPELRSLARVAAFSNFRGVELASSPCASGRTRFSAPRLLRSHRMPRTVLGAQSASSSALFPSRPIHVVASGREMVVLSVPAEVTVILLDIEGTTTPIAFVKVRGGRERGSYLCLKAKKFFKYCRPCNRNTRGRRGGVALYPLWNGRK